jgi:hypothetical protein
MRGFENYEKLLFTDYERAWDGQRLSEIFKREMSMTAWGPASVGFQEYRQLANDESTDEDALEAGGA